MWREKKKKKRIQVALRVGECQHAGGFFSERWLLVASASLAALDEFGQRVPKFVQLEELAVQQLEQGAQALVKGLPLLLVALQTLLQIAQLGLQRLVPRLRVLKQFGSSN